MNISVLVSTVSHVAGKLQFSGKRFSPQILNAGLSLPESKFASNETESILTHVNDLDLPLGRLKALW